MAGKRILGTTITLHFRAGIGSEVAISEAGPEFFAVAEAQGGALAWLAVLDGDLDPPNATIDYRALGRLNDKDRRVVRYLGDRYDPALDIATKFILLMVESELNATEVVLPLGDATHHESIFRARLVSLCHSLRAVDQILATNQQATTATTQGVRSLLSDAKVRRLLDDPSLKRLRNRCMHYEIRDKSIRLDPSLPMFGIVESLCPGDSFESLDSELTVLVAQLADTLHQWGRSR